MQFNTTLNEIQQAGSQQLEKFIAAIDADLSEARLAFAQLRGHERMECWYYISRLNTVRKTIALLAVELRQQLLTPAAEAA